MDFYNELLESYARLKQRKLKLRESSDAEAKAAQAKDAAMSMQPRPTSTNPYVVQGVRASVAIFETPTGKKAGWKFAPMAKDGSGIAANGTKYLQNPEHYKVFVGFFKTEEEKEETAEAAPEEEAPAEPEEEVSTEPEEPEEQEGGDLEEFAPQMTEDEAEIMETFIDLEAQLPKVFTGMDKSLLTGTPWSDFKTFKAGILELQTQVTNLKTHIGFNPKSKSYVSQDVPANPEVSKEVSNNLAFIAETLGKDNLSENDKNKIASLLAVNSDGTVSIFQDVIDSGLVFKDDSGLLKLLAKAHAAKSSIKFRKIDVKKHKSTTADNRVRGIALEEILPVMSLMKRQIELQKINHPAARTIQIATKKAFDNVKKRLNKLSGTYQVWVNSFKSSAFEPDDATIIRQLSALFGGNGRELFSSIFRVSREAINVRQPDLILAKGTETGAGRRHDTFELFNNFDKARSALLKMGYTDEEITTKGLIRKGSMDTVFADHQDLKKTALDAELFNPKEPVYYLAVSLKNYIELDEAVFGTATENATSDFIQGVGPDPDNKFLKKYQESFGQTPEQYEATKAYSNKLDGLSTSIRALPARARVKGTSTKLKRVTPLASFVDASLAALKANSTYDELNDVTTTEESKMDFAKILKTYKESTENRSKIKSEKLLDEKVKVYASNYLKNQKLIADIDKGDEAAKQYLAMKVFAAGGVVDDSLVCDYRGLVSKESHNFLQNDVVKDVIGSWLKNSDGPWKLRASGKSFVFYNEEDKSQTLKVNDKILTRGGFSTSTLCSVSKGMLTKYSRKRRKLERTLEALVSIQNDFYRQLLSIKEEIGIVSL